MDTENALKQTNKSGFPFQLKVVNEIMRTRPEHGWRVASKEHGWSSTGFAGFIDIVLVHDHFLTFRLVIECKKIRSEDARQLRWMFLLPETGPLPTKVASCLEVDGRGTRLESGINAGVYDWYDLRVWDNVRLKPESHESGFCILSGDEPSRQPLLERLAGELLESVEGLAEEEIRIRKSSEQNHLRLFIFPAVVTNAELVTGSFDPADVKIRDGTIDIEQIEFTTVPFIRFRKSLATNFPKGEFQGLEDANKARERTIFVVNAACLSEFLKDWELKPLHNQYAIQRVLNRV